MPRVYMPLPMTNSRMVGIKERLTKAATSLVRNFAPRTLLLPLHRELPETPPDQKDDRCKEQKVRKDEDEDQDVVRERPLEAAVPDLEDDGGRCQQQENGDGDDAFEARGPLSYWSCSWQEQDTKKVLQKQGMLLNFLLTNKRFLGYLKQNS